MAIEQVLEGQEKVGPRLGSEEAHNVIEGFEGRQKSSAVMTAEQRQETSPTVAVVAEPAKPAVEAPAQNAKAETKAASTTTKMDLTPNEMVVDANTGHVTYQRSDAQVEYMMANLKRKEADSPITGEEVSKEELMKRFKEPEYAREKAIKKATEYLDANHDGIINKEELEKHPDFLKSMEKMVARQSASTKNEIIENINSTAQSTGNNPIEIGGIKIDKDASELVNKTILKGASSPNPDPAIAAREEEEKKEAAKAGKGEKKDFLTMLIDFIMTALGLNKEEEKQKETAVAAQQNTPKEQTTDGKGTGEPQKAQGNDMDIIASLNKDIQARIKEAGLGDKVMLQNVPQTESTPQVQAGGGKRIDTSFGVTT